jgi:hypothetical protein
MMETDPASETMCILNIPQAVENVQYSISIIMEEMRNFYKIFVGKFEPRRRVWVLNCKLHCNIKIHVRGSACQSNWLRRLVNVHTAMNILHS